VEKSLSAVDLQRLEISPLRIFPLRYRCVPKSSGRNDGLRKGMFKSLS
jgi:hypothetical protein